MEAEGGQEKKKDFTMMTASTFQEKLSVLEERDKHIREKMLRKRNRDGLKGTCPDMCPEKERLQREVRCSFSIYESVVVGNERHVVPELLVKEYARSSADQEEPLSHELRPEPVLTMTMSHLIKNIMNRTEQGWNEVSEWYHFCCDRLRSIRKDIIQQQLCNMKVVKIMEQCARFHIWCYDTLCDQDKHVYDDKLNTENLVNCLQLLFHMYDDLSKCDIVCENEAEFRVYMGLLQLNEPDVVWFYHKYSKRDNLRPLMSELGDIYVAYSQIWYTRFFSLAEKTSYLNGCILQRYFENFRIQSLKVIVDSHCPGVKTVKVWLPQMESLLRFDDAKHAADFVTECGLLLDNNNTEVILSKAQFVVPSVNRSISSNLVKRKRIPLVDLLMDNDELPSEDNHEIHCSFSSDDILNENALDASDQKDKLASHFKNYNRDDDNVFKVLISKRPTLKKSPQMKQDVLLDLEDEDDGSQETNLDSEDVTDSEYSVTDIELMQETEKVQVEGTTSTKPKRTPFFQQASWQPLDEMEFLKFPFGIPEPSDTANKFSSKQESSKARKCPNVIFLDNKDLSCENKPVSVSPAAAKQFYMSGEEMHPVDISESFTVEQSRFLKNYHQFRDQLKESAKVGLIQKQTTYRENKRLRKIVRRNLRRGYARKFATRWRDKIRKEKISGGLNMGGHLSVKQHLQMWGKHDGIIPANIVERVSLLHNVSEKVEAMLNPTPPVRIPFIGTEIADILATAMMVPSVRTNIFYWKCVISLPDTSQNSGIFLEKVQELVHVSLSKEAKAGNVFPLYTSEGVRILVSLRVETASQPDLDCGLNAVVFLTYQKWESTPDAISRLNQLVEHAASAVPLILITVDNVAADHQLLIHLRWLKRRSLVRNFTLYSWKNYYTILESLRAACAATSVAPSVKVQKFTELFEHCITDFFLVLSDKSYTNCPNTIVKLYNKFLAKLNEEILNPDWYVPPEFVPYLKETVSKNNLQDANYVTRILSSLQLPYFKSWPPKSVAKMVKIVRKYCQGLEDDLGSLFPNVLRLINPNPSNDEMDLDLDLQVIPWLHIVEIWVKYNARMVCMQEEYVKDLVICCSYERISNLTTEFSFLSQEI